MTMLIDTCPQRLLFLCLGQEFFSDTSKLFLRLRALLEEGFLLHVVRSYLYTLRCEEGLQLVIVGGDGGLLLLQLLKLSLQLVEFACVR